MRKGLFGIVGVIAIIAGVVWTLQGLGVIGGSVMTGSTMWAVIGPLVALAGLAVLTFGLRSRRG
jgi:hypothetical protein